MRPLLANRTERGAPLPILTVEQQDFIALAKPKHIAEIVGLAGIEFDLSARREL
jgi:hypothetical protein